MNQNNIQTKPVTTQTLETAQKVAYQKPKLEQHQDYKMIVASSSGF